MANNRMSDKIELEQSNCILIFLSVKCMLKFSIPYLQLIVNLCYCAPAFMILVSVCCKQSCSLFLCVLEILCYCSHSSTLLFAMGLHLSAFILLGAQHLGNSLAVVGEFFYGYSHHLKSCCRNITSLMYFSFSRC